MGDKDESEETVTRNDAATALRGIADGVDAGSLWFDQDDAGFAVAVPEEMELEIELEREDGSLGIEIELEWPDSEAEISEAEPPEPVSEDEQPPVTAAEPRESLARFELFRDRADEWRWRLVHRNGNVIAASGEGYTRKHNAEKGLRSVMQNAAAADIGAEGDSSLRHQ